MLRIINASAGSLKIWKFKSSGSVWFKDRRSFFQLPMDEQKRMMMRNICSMCVKYGHWGHHHNTDSSLPAATKSVDLSYALNNKGNTVAKRTLRLKKVRAGRCSNDARGSQTTSVRGPLVDIGAPYSAIRIAKLQLTKQNIGYDVSDSLMSISLALNGRICWQRETGKHFSAKRRILDLQQFYFSQLMVALLRSVRLFWECRLSVCSVVILSEWLTLNLIDAVHWRFQPVVRLNPQY